MVPGQSPARRSGPRRVVSLPLVLCLLFCGVGLCAVQCVFLLAQESQARRLAARFTQLVEDHREQATLPFLTRELSDMARLGLIRCYRLSERSLIRQPSEGCGQPRILLGSSTVEAQVVGATGVYWNVSFESLNSQEFYFALYLMRALVLVASASLWIGASRFAAWRLDEPRGARKAEDSRVRPLLG